MKHRKKYSHIDVAEAIEQQRCMARQVQERPFSGKIGVVAGADAAFSKDEKYCIAAVVSFSWPNLELIETAEAKKPLNFPYIPGFLSFREAPAVAAAARKLKQKPDILLIDGQGRAHPRRFGLACHVGLDLGWPTIGCAKSRLIGEHRPVVVRSRDDVKCLYVSVGHLMEMDEAVRVVLRCCRRYRLPEPTRQAHNLVSQNRR